MVMQREELSSCTWNLS